MNHKFLTVQQTSTMRLIVCTIYKKIIKQRIDARPFLEMLEKLRKIINLKKNDSWKQYIHPGVFITYLPSYHISLGVFIICWFSREGWHYWFQTHLSLLHWFGAVSSHLVTNSLLYTLFLLWESKCSCTELKFCHVLRNKKWS